MRRTRYRVIRRLETIESRIVEYDHKTDHSIDRAEMVTAYNAGELEYEDVTSAEVVSVECSYSGWSDRREEWGDWSEWVMVREYYP